MDAGAIRALAAAMAEAGLARLELSGPDLRLLLERGPKAAADAAAPDGDTAGTTGEPATILVRSPLVGTFLRSHPLHERPLVADGEPVKAGRPLALVRVGDLLLPVRAPAAGTVARALVRDDTLVGYGDALLELLPEA